NVNQPTTGLRRQRDANSDKAQDEAGSTEHAYILPSILAQILEDYPGKTSFSICPTAPSKNVFIPLYGSYTRNTLTCMGDFVKSTKNYIHHKLQRAETHQDILTINNTKNCKFQKKHYYLMLLKIMLPKHSSKMSPGAEEALSFIVDLGKSAVIDLPNLVNIKRSKHATDLRKMLENERQIPRYTIRMLRTNDVCLQAVMTDWVHPRRKQQQRQFKYLPEIRKFAFRKCEELGQHDANLFDEYEGVFGTDLGETWTVGAFIFLQIQNIVYNIPLDEMNFMVVNLSIESG
ncbi:hypothetical protein BDC45DRAFT_510190, partial [Circinella umbellata]